jgi:hypothetical protein
MKKRLLSALLALALVFVLLPTTALAETPAIKIAGTVIEDGKYYYTNGGIGELKTEAQQKTWNVRREGNTLYLRNANIKTTNMQSIEVWLKSVTISLEGNSTINTNGEGSIVSQLAGSLTIKGNGKLTIESNTAGSSIIWNSGDVTITGDAVVNITNENSGQSSDAIGLVSSYELTVSENAKLRAVSNGSKAATVNGGNLTIADNAEFNVINQNSSGKAVSFKSIEVAAGYDCNGINGNGITDWTKTTAEELNTFQKVWVKPTPTPTLEKSNVCVAGTNLYKNTAYTIQNGKPVMGGTYPDNYNIYLDTTGSNYVLYVNNADIKATGNNYGIFGTSNIVFKGTNSITTERYGIYSDFNSSDLNISGTGSLTIKANGSNSAIANSSHTSKSIIISGNDFTVTADTSGTTSYAIKSDKDLTITGGAAVTAKSNATRAIDIKGNLTVTNGSLKATSTSNSVPTVQVGGNASFTGSTVTITNNSTTQGEQYKDSNAASSALHVNGAVTISGGTVTAEAKAGGNAIRAVGNITVSNDATVTAKNNSQYFNAITAGRATGGEVNTLYNLIVSGENTRITATNAHDNKLAYGGAINAYIKNANEGHYLKVGTDTKAIAPNVKTTVKNNSLTITRGDAYETPQVTANYKIAGQTMHVGQYYKTDAKGNITDGTAQDYNIYCDSENDFTLNNATISSTGTGGSTGVIMTNLNASSNEIHIKLIGTNSINNAGHHAILGEGAYSTIFIENAENASNASLTISGNYLPVYSYGNVTINAEVVIINTNGNLISTNKDGHANGAFDLGSGYKCYASTSTTGTPLEEFNSANYSTYKYLRVTTQTLETGGGSTHQHTWDTTKWYSVGDDYHARKCTGCDEYDLTNKQAHYAWPDEDKGPEGHTEKCMLCDYKYDQSVIKPHEWTGWWVSDYQPEVHAQRCNCGYQGSTHRTLKYVAINSEQHQKQCPVDGCGYKIEYKTSHVYEEGSNICTECGYDKSAPCNHTGDRVYTNNGDGTHKVTCKACGATIVEKETHEFDPTGACVCGATQSGGNPTPDNPGTIVIIRPAEEEKPAQQPNPSTGANDLVGLAVAAAVAAALGSAALLRKHD